MQKLSVGVIVALTLVVLGYAALVAFDSDHPQPVAQSGAKRSSAETAARDRMARLVAEVAARSAAQTAKSVALNRMQPQQLQVAEEKTASR